MVRKTQVTIDTEYLVVLETLRKATSMLDHRFDHRAGKFEKIVYRRLASEQRISEGSLVTATRKLEIEQKQIGLTKAIEEYTEKYPKQAERLHKIIERKKREKKKILTYGLIDPKNDLPMELYINAIKELGIPEPDAIRIYLDLKGATKYFKEKEESGLVIKVI